MVDKVLHAFNNQSYKLFEVVIVDYDIYEETTKLVKKPQNNYLINVISKYFDQYQLNQIFFLFLKTLRA